MEIGNIVLFESDHQNFIHLNGKYVIIKKIKSEFKVKKSMYVITLEEVNIIEDSICISKINDIGNLNIINNKYDYIIISPKDSYISLTNEKYSLDKNYEKFL